MTNQKSFHLPVSLLFISVLLLFSPTHVQAAKRVALVIGNSAYSASPLKNPVNDARDVSQALKNLGFKVVLATDADKKKMVASINEFADSLRKADIGFFFYAGHGMQISGSNYLIPVGVEVSSASDVEFEAVHAGRVLGKMEEAGNKLNIVVLDACRNNPFRSYFRSGEKGLARMDAPVGTVIAYATGPGSVAADGRGRNGLYTKHLLQTIAKPGLSVQQMFNQAGLGVMRETKRKQVPWVSNTPIEPVYLAGGLSVLEESSQRTEIAKDVGSIQISSNPSGAIVFIDGKRAGETPVELGDMGPGSKTIRVAKDGYATEEKQTTIRKGRRSIVSFDLAQEVRKGWLTVSPSPSLATVRILNINPPYHKDMALDPGSYHVEVSASGYTTKQQWVELAAGDALDVDITLQKAQAAPSRGFTESTTGMEFVRIPGGCFQMGSPSSEKDREADEGPVHEVCVDDLYMGKHEVTVGQWRTFIQETSYRTDAEKDAGDKKGCYSYKEGKWDWRDGSYWDKPGFSQSASQPVACVSYNDVEAYIKWLNQKNSKTFRLPSDAEWEYAARGGTSTSRYWGDDPDDACGYANVLDRTSHDGISWNSEQRHNCNDNYFFSAPVGTYKPNSYGLYDMLGNVWEWCSDKYGKDYYASSPRRNPQGASSGSHRVDRGGSWNSRPAYVRAAGHDRLTPATRYDNMGFRLVSPGQ